MPCSPSKTAEKHFPGLEISMQVKLIGILNTWMQIQQKIYVLRFT